MAVRGYTDYIDYGLLASGRAGGVNTLIKSLHSKQHAFFVDPAKAKALLAGRQSGKTWGASVWLVADWQKYPGQRACYITNTARAAKRRAWPIILKICEKYKINVVVNHSELTVRFPNGFTIWCTGAETKDAADSIRGEASGFVKIVIDEPATFRDEILEYLCTEAADATLMQHNGDIALCGTPGPIPEGFYYKLCHEMGWSVHKFTPYDNPHVPAEEYINNYLKKYGYTKDTPRVRREIFAEWVLDTESLIYIANLPIFLERNGFYELPYDRPPDFTTLGLDLGYDPDPCAYVIASSYESMRNVYIRRAYTKGKQTPDEIAAEIRRLDKEYNINEVIVDAGGGGKTTAKALEASYGVKVVATPKGHKRPKIDLVRGTINSGVLKIHLIQAQALISEYKTVLWDEDRKNHHPLSFDHCCDATIQAVMAHSQSKVDYTPSVDPYEGISDQQRRILTRLRDEEDESDEWLEPMVSYEDDEDN